jgi:membrane protease YdiL (CAAX protease family)
MSNVSSEPKNLAIRPSWGLFDGAFLWFLAYRAPQYFVSELAPYLTPVLPQAENLRNVVLYLLIELITVATIAVVVRAYGLGLRDLGLGRFKRVFIPKILLGYFAYVALTIAVLALAQSVFMLSLDEKQSLGFQNPTSAEAVAIFFILILVVPFTEELLFRGFLFRAVRSKLNFVWTALIVSTLFGLVHGAVVVGLDVFVLSLVLCYLRERTNSLWPGIILHALKNSVAFLILFIYNG